MLSNIQPLRTALDLAPIFEYNSKEVKDIKHDAFEAMREKFAEDLENIKKANAEQLDRMARQHDEAIARLRADAQRERDEFARRMDQMSADHQRQLAALNEKLAAANKSPGFFESLVRVGAAIGTGGLSEIAIAASKI